MNAEILKTLQEFYFLFIKEASLTSSMDANSAADFMAWLDKQVTGYDQSSISKEIKDKIKK